MLNELLNIALLGTGKTKWQMPETFPEALKIHHQQEDEQQERHFYRICALSHAYFGGGRSLGSAWHQDWQKINLPPPSSGQKKIPPEVMNIMESWLNHESFTLCNWGISILRKNQYSIPLAWMHRMMIFLHQKRIPIEEWKSILDERGQMLFQFSHFYQKERDELDENNWDSAALAERLLYLENWRKKEPQEALQAIQSFWKKEAANIRKDYLRILKINLSHADLDFLEKVHQEDRSSQVRDLARSLLFLIDGSSLNQQYASWLQERLSFCPKSKQWIKAEKPFTEAMKKAGLSELSSYKDISDSDFQIFQLALPLLPSSWAQVLSCSEEEAIHILARHKPPFSEDYMEIWLYDLSHRPLLMALCKSSASWSQNEIQILFHHFLDFSSDEKETLLQEKHLFSLRLAKNILFHQNEWETWGKHYSLWLLLALASFYQGSLRHTQDSAYDAFVAALADDDEVEHFLTQVLPKKIESNPSESEKEYYVSELKKIMVLYQQKQSFLEALRGT